MFSRKLKDSLIMKTVCLCLAAVFLFGETGFGIPGATGGIVPSESLVDDLMIDDMGIALDVGSLSASYRGDSGKTIIHIQDAHCNYEAQINISRMLELFTGEHGVGLISVEGAKGIVDTSWFRALPDERVRESVADYFMKRGELTGVEFFSITSDFDGTIFGAETRADYIANLKAFTDSYAYKSDIERYLRDLDTVAGRLKSMIYPERLQYLDSKIASFARRDLELGEYALFLRDFSDELGLDVRAFHDFMNLQATLAFEEKIDFDLVNQERSEYMDLLSERLDESGAAELVAQSVRFKRGRISPADFYSYLRDLAREENIPLVREFPNLFYYHVYARLYESIDVERLFEQIDLIERGLKDKLFITETERQLDRYAEMVNMSVNLVNIELTNGDYDRFLAYSSEFTLDDIVEKFAQLSDRYGLSYRIGAVPAQLEQNMSNMRKFYEVALKRDRVLVENTLKRMELEGRDRGILITGGFHTRGIKEILEHKGVSYVVATPRIMKSVDSPYIEILTNQRTSIADGFTDDASTGPDQMLYNTGMLLAGGEVLSPLLKAGMLVNWYLDPAARADLEGWSEEIGAINGQTVTEATQAKLDSVVYEIVRQRVEEIRRAFYAARGEREAAREWREFVANREMWELLLRLYLKQYRDAGEPEDRAGVISGKFEEMFDRVNAELRREFSVEGPAVARAQALGGPAGVAMPEEISATVSGPERDMGVLHQRLENNAAAMATSAAEGRGPDVVIIVSATDEQAAFWQERLTGDDGIHGSGQTVKGDAIVLSVSESNWQTSAGNGLGTLNGFMQAARKMRQVAQANPGIERFAAFHGLGEEPTYAELKQAMMGFCADKSAFMYHTAGKGTRTAPLPGAEVNSKPNIKLPEMVNVHGRALPMTVLEAVLMQTAMYAGSRTGRLGVFWGDQIIINENEVTAEPKHHIEILGQKVAIDENIVQYGTLLPDGAGNVMQREKISEEKVRSLVEGDEAYKSIGSFTVSLPFLRRLMDLEESALNEEYVPGPGEHDRRLMAKLDTDPDWWQPLTSTWEEYSAMVSEKGMDLARARDQWERMDKLWEDFSSSEDFDHQRFTGKVGLLDVGEESLWWDYGQNEFLLHNVLLLVEHSFQGRAARRFFGVPEDNWVDSEQTVNVQIENSVIKNSRIERGSLKNCVVINSNLKEVNAENAVIIGSFILKLDAIGGLVYNVVDEKVSLWEGHVLANIFHPEQGRIEMRTHISRDGSDDWRRGTLVYDNLYTYEEIADLNKDVKLSDVEKVKADAVQALGTDRFSPEVSLSPADRARHLVERRNYDPARARRVVVSRMVEFGDIGMDDFTPELYAGLFGQTIDEAMGEFSAVNAIVRSRRIFKEQAKAARSGPKTLETALANLEEWIVDPRFREYRQALIELVDLAEQDAGAAKELYDSFWRTIPFGTGGRRWKVGIGPNRMNAYMAAVTAQGHVEYLKQQYPELVARGDAIAGAWDTRAFHKFFAETESLRRYREVMEAHAPAIKGLSSEDLSKIAALVYAGNGIRYIHSSQRRPTPWLSFLVNAFEKIPSQQLTADTRRKLAEVQNIMGGVVLSSSHNPYDNNGTKFYEDSGAQAPPQIVQQLMDLGDKVEGVNYYGGEAIYEGGRDAAFDAAVEQTDLIVVLNDDDLGVIDDVLVDITIEEVRSPMPETFDDLVADGAFGDLLVAFNAINGTGDTILMKIFEKLGFGAGTGVLRHPDDTPDWEFALGYGNVPNPEAEKTFNTLFEISVMRTLRWAYDPANAAVISPSNIKAVIDEEGAELSLEELERENGVVFTSAEDLFGFVKERSGKYIRGVVFTGNEDILSSAEAFNKANNIGLMTDPDADRVGLGVLKMEKGDGALRLEWVSANDNDESGIILFRYRLEKLLDLAKKQTPAGENALVEYIKARRPDYQDHVATKKEPYQLVMVNTVVSNPLETKIADMISKEISAATGGLVEVRTVTHHVGFKFTGEIIDLINAGEYPDVSVTGAVMRDAGIDLPRAMFVMSSEEGEGSLIGFRGSIDKDSGVTGLELAVIAAEQLREGRTLHDYLMETYKKYGYSKTYLEPMVMTGDYGFDMINEKIMGYLRGTVLPGIAQGEPFTLGRFSFDKGKDHYDLVRPMMVAAGYTEDPATWPNAIRESVNILEFETELEDGTVIKVVARPSGTEPKHKNLVMVIGAPSLSISEVNKLNREVMDEIMIECYKASEAEYSSSVKEHPGVYRVADLAEGDLRELLKVFPIVVSTEAKLSVYFPLRDWIIERSQELSSLQGAARQAKYDEFRAVVEKYLINFKETDGVQFVEEAVAINLMEQLGLGKIDREAVRMQAHLWFGEQIGESRYRDLLNDVVVQDDARLARAVIAAREAVQAGQPLRVSPLLKTGREGYTWGELFDNNIIAALLGDRVDAIKSALSEAYGISIDEVGRLPLGERWLGAGAIEIAGELLPAELLGLFGEPENTLTAKLLHARQPLSVQYHRFSEMIVPLEEGTAYIGLKEDMTKEDYRTALREGRAHEVLNEVKLLPGVPYIIPAFTLHAYGQVKVYEVKGVTPAEDSAGTVSHYDRLKLLEYGQQVVGEVQSMIDRTSDHVQIAGGIAALRTELLNRGLIPEGANIDIRQGKDIVTMPDAKAEAILDELERHGSLHALDPDTLKFDVEIMARSEAGSRYSVLGRTDDYETGRYDIRPADTMDSYEGSRGKLHGLFVKQGSVTVVDAEGAPILDGRGEPIVLNAGEEVLMPTTRGEYALASGEEGAVIFTQYVPERGATAESPAIDMKPVKFEVGPARPVLGEKLHDYVVKGEFSPGGRMTESVEVNNGEALIPGIVQDRPVILTVRRGGPVDVAIGEHSITMGAGTETTSVMVVSGMAVTSAGAVFHVPEKGLEIRLSSPDRRPAEVELRYKFTPAEELVYTIFSQIVMNIEAVSQQPVDILFEEERFSRPGIDGNQADIEDILNNLVLGYLEATGQEERYRKVRGDKLYRVVTYSAREGLTDAVTKSLRPEARTVLGVTRSNFQAVDESDESVMAFLRKSNTQVLPLPELPERAAYETEGSFYALELAGTALLQATLNARDIREQSRNARSFQLVMNRWVETPVRNEQLYFFLPFQAVDRSIREVISETLGIEAFENVYDHFRYLIDNLMPVEPVIEQLREMLDARRRIMWSA